MAGRPRKPHKLRVLEGGRGKSRPMTPDLPAPESPLAPPVRLARAEAAAWKLHAKWVRQLGLESNVDSGQFLAMVRAYCRALAADAVVARKGMSYELKSQGSVCARPEVAIGRQAWKDYALLADKFGLSATSRAKLGTGGKAPEKAGDVPAELRDAGGGGA